MPAVGHGVGRLRGGSSRIIGETPLIMSSCSPHSPRQLLAKANLPLPVKSEKGLGSIGVMAIPIGIATAGQIHHGDQAKSSSEPLMLNVPVVGHVKSHCC